MKFNKKKEKKKKKIFLVDGEKTNILVTKFQKFENSLNKI